MLLRSGENLFNETKKFCEESNQIWLYSPFIRVNKLIELFENPEKIKSIVVRWQTMDILVGVTDFEELYEFCETNKITLYRNTKIHLKVMRNENNHIFFGSANFTNMGIGNNGNLELSGINKEKCFKDSKYLNKILTSSDLVNSDYFKVLKLDIEEKRNRFKKIEKINDKDITLALKNKFLLDSLPQSDHPKKVWEIFHNKFDENKFSGIEIECARHDIKSYSNIKSNNHINKEWFFSTLREGFNSNLFISELKSEIRNKNNLMMGYTEITKWISKTTLSVPTPSRHDIKDKRWVNRLHNWIPFFDPDNFHSEKRHKTDGGTGGTNLIHFIGNDLCNDVEDLFDLFKNLRVNNKGGKSPHQFILLASINELVKKNKQLFKINEIEEEFNRQWLNTINMNPRAKKNFAMPLNALSGKFIVFNYLDNNIRLNNYRSESELKEKVDTILISDTLYKLFNNNNFSTKDILNFYNIN